MKHLVLALSMLLGVAAAAQVQAAGSSSTQSQVAEPTGEAAAIQAKAAEERAKNAGISAVTLDGRKVLLKSDNTWQYVTYQEGNPAESAVLTVTRMWEMGDACKLQFRLKNNLGYRISALVPRMTIQNKDGIIYDTKSLSFASIKPTDTQYTEIQFSGIGCHNIEQLKVFDAARCRMGKIDQWNEAEGECLSHLIVEPSSDINISK